MFTKLKQRRVELGLTQQQAAEFIGIPKSSYSNYEYKNMGSHNKVAQKIIASGILGGTNAEEIKRQFREEKRRERNKRRIPNVPNFYFYGRLNELCDENGHIRKGVNDELLKELQRDLGVRTADTIRDLNETNRRQAIPELPEIPDYVAEYITSKKENSFPLYQAIRIVLENSRFTGTKLKLWLCSNENQEIFAKAWVIGYTVEEKKYVVQVAGGYYLGKEITKGIMLIDSEGQNWSQDEVPSLTEKEIKDHNPRFWPLAREVTK